MSDLQCPATLLIARHGEAADAVGGVLSDDGGGLTDQGRAQVRHLVEQVRPRRIAEIYSSTMHRAVQSAELASSGLGVRCILTEGLQEFSVGELGGISYQDPRAKKVFDAWRHGDLAVAYPGGEDGHAVVNRFKDTLEEIADTHRGETVLVLTHGGVMSVAVPRLSQHVRNDFAAQWLVPNCVVAEVQIDADGWRILSWPQSGDQQGLDAADLQPRPDQGVTRKRPWAPRSASIITCETNG